MTLAHPRRAKHRPRGRLPASGEHDVGFGHTAPNGVGGGNHGFRHCRVLEQQAFKLERGDAVIRRFEDIVGAPRRRWFRSAGSRTAPAPKSKQDRRRS